MSRDAEIILIASLDEEDNFADLMSFGLGAAEAVDAEAIKVIQEVAGQLASESGDVQVALPLNRAGHLMPLTGAVEEELWGASSHCQSASGEE